MNVRGWVAGVVIASLLVGVAGQAKAASTWELGPWAQQSQDADIAAQRAYEAQRLQRMRDNAAMQRLQQQLRHEAEMAARERELQRDFERREAEIRLHRELDGLREQLEEMRNGRR